MVSRLLEMTFRSLEVFAYERWPFFFSIDRSFQLFGPVLTLTSLAAY